MARASTVVQTGQTVRPFAAAVRRLAFASRSCGNCGSPEIRPSTTRNAVDVVLACLFLSPFRCRACRERFYRFWRPSFLNPPDPPVAPLLLVPARREERRAELAAPLRIEPEVLPPRQQPRLIPEARRNVIPAKPVVLPIEKVQHPPDSDAAAPAVPVPAGSVLILEGDVAIRRLLRRLLDRRGYFTVEVAGVEQVESELHNRHSGLLVVDISETPAIGASGVTAIAAAHAGLKILVLSSDAIPQVEVPGRILALRKPFGLERFVECVDRLMSGHSMTAGQPN